MFKDKEGEPRIYWHASSRGNSRRVWLHVFKTVFHAELSAPALDNSLSLNLWLNGISEDDTITFSISVLKFFAVYISVSNHKFSKILPGKMFEYKGRLLKLPTERKTGISIHHGTVWFSLWENPMEWNRSDPWWWQFSFDYVDFFLGKTKRESVVKSSGVVDVTFGEEKYSATYEEKEITTKRPRWKSERFTRFNIDMLVPIPVPGKGENSWDMDDDAVYSYSAPASTLEEAVDKLTASVISDRRRHGGEDWTP